MQCHNNYPQPDVYIRACQGFPDYIKRTTNLSIKPSLISLAAPLRYNVAMTPSASLVIRRDQVKWQARMIHTYEQVPLDTQQRIVLVADDDDWMHELTSAAIISLGLTPLMVSDGASAVEYATRWRDALVCAILDIDMPIMNGVEAAQTIQGLLPNLAIMLISDGYAVQPVPSVKNPHTPVILRKPFLFSTLRKTLAQIIENPPGGNIAEPRPISLEGAEDQA